MVLCIWIIKLTDWGGRRFRIGVERLEVCLDVLYFFVSGIEEIFVRCSVVDEVIRSIVFNILLGFLHLEVDCLRV